MQLHVAYNAAETVHIQIRTLLYIEAQKLHDLEALRSKVGSSHWKFIFIPFFHKMFGYDISRVLHDYFQHPFHAACEYTVAFQTRPASHNRDES